MNYEFKIERKRHSHSHFYSHFGFLKIRKPCFTLILLILLKIGAGEGNRTLVSIHLFQAVVNQLNEVL